MFVLRLAWLVVGSLVEVVVGQDHLAAVEVGLLVVVVVVQCHLAKLLVGVLIGVVVGEGHLAELVVGVLVEVVVGQGHLAEVEVGVLVRIVVGQGHLAELLFIGGVRVGGGITRQTRPELLLKSGRRHFERMLLFPPLGGGIWPRAGLGSWLGRPCLPVFVPK